MQYPPGPPPAPSGPPPPPQSDAAHAGGEPGRAGGEENELFRAYRAATPPIWLRWLITLGIYEFFRRRTIFIVTSRRVIVRSGVIHRTERSIPVGRIQDISSRKGLFTGRVELSSAGGALGVESFGPLWNPSVERMSQAIEQLIAGA